MMRRHVQAACVALVVSAASIFGTAAMAENAELQDLLSEFHQRYGFPGATAAITLPEGEIVTAGTGLADVEANRPMAPDTPMLSASIGKSFAAGTLLSSKPKAYCIGRTWCRNISAASIGSHAFPIMRP